MAVFWDVAASTLVEVETFRRFILPPSSGLITLKMEAVSTAGKSIKFYMNTRRNIPEDCHLHTRENL
jgi:hypothetical protein